MATLGKGIGQLGLGAMAGGPSEAAGMLGQQGSTFGGIAKQLMKDRIANKSGILGNMLNDEDGSEDEPAMFQMPATGGPMGGQMQVPGNGPVDSERIVADVRPGETLTFTPPGETPPPNPNPVNRRAMIPYVTAMHGAQHVGSYGHGGQYIGGFQEGGQVKRKSAWDRLGSAEKWTGGLLGVLDFMGSGNPASLMRTPWEFGEMIQKEDATQRQREFYQGELKALGDPGDDSYSAKRHEELLGTLADIQSPRMKDFQYRTRDKVSKGGLTKQAQDIWGDPYGENMQGTGLNKWTKYGDEELTAAGSAALKAMAPGKPDKTVPQWRQDHDRTWMLMRKINRLDQTRRNWIFRMYKGGTQETLPADSDERILVKDMHEIMDSPVYTGPGASAQIADWYIKGVNEFERQIQSQVGEEMGLDNPDARDDLFKGSQDLMKRFTQ